METTLTGFGNMMRDFFHMATWMEPFGGIRNRKETNFPQDWTIFYWSWWLVYAPFIGLFIARISKGRRLKEVILEQLLMVHWDVSYSLVFLVTMPFIYKLVDSLMWLIFK